jgi:hypothetical protein
MLSTIISLRKKLKVGASEPKGQQQHHVQEAEVVSVFAMMFGEGQTV